MSKRAALIVAALSALTIAVTLIVAWPSHHPPVLRAEGSLAPGRSSPAVPAPPSVPASRTDPGPSGTSAPTTIPSTLSIPPTTLGPVVAADPVALSIPEIGVAAQIVPVGVVPGTDSIEVPPITEVGWYRFGPRPGEDGSSVLVGHIDGDGRTGIFWELRDLTLGDEVTVRYADGSSRSFVVSGRGEVAKTALPASLFSRQGPAQLTLITCGGAFDSATHHYVDNVVVVAAPQSAGTSEVGD